jgi:hypothetical protein
MPRENKGLVVNLVCPPGQFAVRTLWDHNRINHAVNKADDDGWHEIQGIDENDEVVIARWKENSTLFYTVTQYKPQAGKPNLAIARGVLPGTVQ